MPRLSLGADDFQSRCAAISLLVLDVDGVMTDGVIGLDDRGVESKRFYVRDGSALAFWRHAGHRVAILSGRRAAAVDLRGAELGIHPVVQGAKDKGPAFEQLVADLGLTATNACFMGDDIPDLRVLTFADLGLAACPGDSCPEVIESCHLVTEAHGGRGAVREVVEIILKAQGKWADVIARNQAPRARTRPLATTSGGRRSK